MSLPTPLAPFLLLFLISPLISAEVPGVVVHQTPIPTTWERITRKAVYTASPSIVVLPDGGYLMTANHFGHGSGASVSGTTFVYRSDDRGVTWRSISRVTDMKRGSLWVHPDRSVYLLGYRAAPGDIVFRRSDDGGYSWTEALCEETGVIRRGTFGGTPNRPVPYGGRIWWAIGGQFFLSAPENADILRADSWTLSRRARIPEIPLGSDLVVTEAQIVASPQTGPVLMPKVEGLPYSLLIRAGETPQQVIQPTPQDWVEFPGGEKKFAAAWDPVSGYFIALSNPVLEAYKDSGWPPELIRNVGAMLVSPDLRDWRIVKIFLKSTNVDRVGFQYFSFDFDGEDLVIASRTAFRMEGVYPPRGHDSNLITFHRIVDFRSYLDSPVTGYEGEADSPGRKEG